MDARDTTRSTRIAGIDLRVLGSFRLEIDGEPLEIGARKNKALIALLALEGPCSRERLADVLWGEFGEFGARKNLRKNLHRLRETALGSYLKAQGETLELRTARVDALEFERHMELLEFERALEVSARALLTDALDPQQAQARLCAHLRRPLEVRLLHTFEGRDGRGKRSISEARFSFLEPLDRWRLVVEYEAFMDSPLYGFTAERFEDLLELNLWTLRVDTPQSGQRWRLERIALHPDWLELLNVSSSPD